MSRSFDAALSAQAKPFLGQSGMKHAIVERELFSGTSVNVSCTPPVAGCRGWAFDWRIADGADPQIDTIAWRRPHTWAHTNGG